MNRLRVNIANNAHGCGSVSEFEALQNLIAAIIKQAVEDYCMCERRGVVREGEIVPGRFDAVLWEREGDEESENSLRKYRGIGRGLTGESQVKELLLFFGESLDALINAACFEVTADAIRTQLKIKK